MADEPDMQKLAEKLSLHGLNGVWRPAVIIGILLSGGSSGIVGYSVSEFQREYYRGQEAQNQRLSELEAQSRAQAQYVNLGELLRSVQRTESKLERVDQQIAEIMRQLADLTRQRSYYGREQ